MSRIYIVCMCSIVMLAATLAVPRTQAQTDTGLKLITELTLPGSRDAKFPHVAAANGQVYISANANRSDAQYWNKADSATSFADPLRLGDAGGQPDFSNTSIAVGPDGAVYYVWDDQPSRTIYLRRRDANGNWGATRTVDSGSSFPIAVEVTVSSVNQIFVAWRDPDEQAKYRRSTDGGASWTSRRRVSDEVAYASPLDLAAGPNGKVGITYTAGTGGRLQVFVGLWNESLSSFEIKRITSLSSDYADSSLTFTPDGNVYAAWRGVEESGGNAGVFYSQRQADGNWPRSRIVGGRVTGTVNINSDEQGNLHLAWIGQPSGGNQIYYAFKPANDSFRGPIASESGSIFNAHAAANASDGFYAHVASEVFNGSRLISRYSLFQAQGAVFGADPQIEGGAATVGGKTTVQVSFTNQRGITGSGVQVRWRWNAAPTDSATDSGGWKTFASTIAVPIPQTILGDTSCRDSTLYTQLRDTAKGVIEDPVKKDSIQVDGVLQGTALAYNPYIAVSSGGASVAGAPELALSKGASGAGDPSYTRVPLLYLNALSAGDCTGITSVSIGKSSSSFETTYKTDGSGFAGLVPLPDLANLETGARPVVVQMKDGAGNIRNFNFTIIYDDEKPVLDDANPGSIGASANTRGDILQNLIFNNIKVSDNLYGGRGFWGVWIANSRSAVPDPLKSNLAWSAMQAPGGNRNFTIKDWSLAAGLSKAQVASGDYYIYVRFLDGAGNATDKVLSLKVTSSATRIGSYAPQINR